MHPSTKWENLNIAFANYLEYIAEKPRPHSLSYVDLLYASNFKNGNSSIIDQFDQVNECLLPYTAILREIERKCEAKPLRAMKQAELRTFVTLAEEFIRLPYKPKTRIRGFRAAYASAVL